MIAEKVVDAAIRTVVTKGMNYVLNDSSDYIKNKYFDGQNDDDNKIMSDVIFDVIKLINYDNKILNNYDDKIVAGFIKTKLEENNSFYKEIDLNVEFIEETIKGIRYDVKLRRDLLEGLKHYPQIIKQKNSAIIKTVCYNLDMKLDDELRTELLLEIDVIKKIFELYKYGASTQEIFQKVYFCDENGYGFAFEFEIYQFKKIFENV